MARRRFPVVAAIAVVLAVVVGIVWWRSGSDAGSDDDDGAAAARAELERTGSITVDGTAPPVEDELDGYRITYRVASAAAPTTTETLSVRRPFTSEVVDAQGAGRRTAFGRLITDSAGVDPVVLAVGPALAGSDVRLAPAVDDAEAAGLLVPREQREVAGRRCQVYRTGTTVIDRPLQAATDDDYADVCIDGRGLLLEEWWVVDGTPFRQRVATEVDEDAPDDLGAGWTELPSMEVDTGGGSILRVRDDSAPPGELFVANDVPASFEHVGRYSVIPPQAKAFSSSANRYDISASTADVWQRGSDVLVLDQGGSLGGRPAFELDRSNRIVDVPGIGEAEVRLGLTMNEVRALRPHGHFVRVYGSLTADELLDVMRGLVATEGTDLVVEDGPLLP